MYTYIYIYMYSSYYLNWKPFKLFWLNSIKSTSVKSINNFWNINYLIKDWNIYLKPKSKGKGTPKIGPHGIIKIHTNPHGILKIHTIWQKTTRNFKNSHYLTKNHTEF
jgi:hypothetical protein